MRHYRAVRPAALLLLALALTACGGHRSASPEQVARAWSAALNRDDNKTAASLFARNAQVIQDSVVELVSKDDALRWNRLLPCGGAILGVTRQSDDTVLVTFQLKERPFHICDGPGQQAAAIFRVQDGKIVVWHQVPPPPPRSTV